MSDVGPGWSPPWRTHSCVPCRDSSRHLLSSLTRCASHARGPGVEKSNRRSLRDRLWRHKPRFGATAPSCISLQVFDAVRARCTLGRSARFMESLDAARRSACATSATTCPTLAHPVSSTSGGLSLVYTWLKPHAQTIRSSAISRHMPGRAAEASGSRRRSR